MNRFILFSCIIACISLEGYSQVVDEYYLNLQVSKGQAAHRSKKQQTTAGQNQQATKTKNLVQKNKNSVKNIKNISPDDLKKRKPSPKQGQFRAFTSSISKQQPNIQLTQNQITDEQLESSYEQNKKKGRVNLTQDQRNTTHPKFPYPTDSTKHENSTRQKQANSTNSKNSYDQVQKSNSVPNISEKSTKVTPEEVADYIRDNVPQGDLSNIIIDRNGNLDYIIQCQRKLKKTNMMEIDNNGELLLWQCVNQPRK